MIPKIAHFYWYDDEELPELRRMSVESFKVLNPGWKVHLHHGLGAPSATFREKVLASDAARYGILSRAGGIYFDSDIVFVKPIPEDWLDTDVLLPANGPGAMYGVHVLGGSTGSPFWVHAVERAKWRMQSKRKLGCQALGVKLWGNENVFEIAAKYGLSPKSIPYAAFLVADWGDVEDLWGPGDVRKDAVGVHWYGGDRMSNEYEHLTYDELPDCVVRNALAVYRGRTVYR